MSSGSGINPSPEALALVDECRKNNSKYLFALFKIDEQGKEVVPCSVFPETAEEQKLVAGLKAQGSDGVAKNYKSTVWPIFVQKLEAQNGPRFAVIDWQQITGEGRLITKLTNIAWCPDKGTTAKSKMTFASTKTSFDAKINIGKKYQANDSSDLEYETVNEFMAKQ